MMIGYEQFFTTNDNLWIDIGIDPDSLTPEEFERIITKDKIENMHKVIRLIQAGTRTVINSYNNKEEPIQLVIMLENNYICAAYNYSECTLNKLYVSDNDKLCRSRLPVGGKFGYALYETSDSLEDRIQKCIMYYNKYHPVKIVHYSILSTIKGLL